MLPGESEIKKDSHCSYCGTRFTEQVLWPRRCFRCYNDSWSNPLPVVVVLMPVIRCNEKRREYDTGLLIQQRNIEPSLGQWALTGGYIDRGETWQEAAVREVKEELDINIYPGDLQLYNVLSSTKKDCMLTFCASKISLTMGGFGHFKPNSEVQAVDVMWEERDLAFPTHTEMANEYLRKLQKQ